MLLLLLFPFVCLSLKGWNCTNFIIYFNLQDTQTVLNPLSEEQFTAMLSLSIILLMTFCVKTGNLDSKQTGGQIMLQPDIKSAFLWSITVLNSHIFQKPWEMAFMTLNFTYYIFDQKVDLILNLPAVDYYMVQAFFRVVIASSEHEGRVGRNEAMRNEAM